ncbi:unnamed protein product [Blepharisma stoltei]|uniref:Intraflagellar transport protein 46 homolog n=1 Tax=Blepharisma stoltei TaxID=1481888 RepID=A0AAU9JWA6_9CILI|nr:unnamed protein product [Blepharisma stoltei]
MHFEQGSFEEEEEGSFIEKQGAVNNNQFDEVYDVEGSEGEVSSSPSESGRREGPEDNSFNDSGTSSPQNGMPSQNQYGQNGLENSESDEGQEIPIKGAYNPADYQDLAVSSEVKELFQYIQRYKPQQIDLATKIRPFVPEYIPSVGEVDAFLKIPRPDGAQEDLGLVVLDEPKLNQSDPVIVEQKYWAIFKQPRLGTPGGAAVRSIENADKNPRMISKWISSIADIHRTKPPATFKYSQNMPDIDSLMDVWHPDIEYALGSIELPGPDIDMDLGKYVGMVCSLLDIPVHNLSNGKSLIESLHVLFTLYSNFKANQHFKQNAEFENNQMTLGAPIY